MPSHRAEESPAAAQPLRERATQPQNLPPARAAGPVSTLARFLKLPSGMKMRLDVVEELLCDLDSVTIAGRHFTMEKVVGLLRVELEAAESELSELARGAVMRALDDLAREESRPLPDAPRFVASTRMITETLAVAS